MPHQRTIFSQILDLIPLNHFQYLVRKFQTDKKHTTFSSYSHLVCMLYAQLSRRRGLRDLVACLNSQQDNLFRIGIPQIVNRSTLAYANNHRDWHLFEALGMELIRIANKAHQHLPHPLNLKEPLYAMDSTTIDLCLSLFPWADYRETKSAIKLHTILDLRGAIPVYINITNGKTNDVKLLNKVELPPLSTIVLDRGYIDFAQLYAFTQKSIYFVIRAKSNLQYQVIQSRVVDKSLGLRADQTIKFKSTKAKSDYLQPLRRVSFFDKTSDQRLSFLSNRFDVPAKTVTDIYKSRWQIELFFKWMKQHLSVDHFFGNTENAVKLQIWTAICAYVLVLLIHRQNKGQITLRILMNILEINLFEKSLIEAVIRASSEKMTKEVFCKPMSLFD